MGRLLIENVRLSFPDLFTPRQVNENSEPKYKASFLFAPDHPAYTALYGEMQKVAADKWGPDGQQVLAGLWSAGRTCLHDGNTRQYEGYAGNMYLSASSEQRPVVVNSDRSPLNKGDGRPYAGCQVNAYVEIYAQDNKYGKRINASLKAVQFAGDGEAFSGSAPVDAEVFPDISATVPAASIAPPPAGNPAAPSPFAPPAGGTGAPQMPTDTAVSPPPVPAGGTGAPQMPASTAAPYPIPQSFAPPAAPGGTNTPPPPMPAG